MKNKLDSLFFIHKFVQERHKFDICVAPSLKMNLTFPVWCAVPLLLALYVLHAAISVLPVLGILAKPPAALAVRE